MGEKEKKALFFKRRKKLLFSRALARMGSEHTQRAFAPRSLQNPVSRPKVFWFFFSKKNRLL
jgi:hypothetical protein